MKKKVFAFIFAIIICFSSFASACALEDLYLYSDAPAVLDYASVLNFDEESQLEDKLSQLCDEYSIDFAVATVTEEYLGWTDITDYADTVYEEYFSLSYTNGAVILVYLHGGEGEREICIVRYGEAESKFSDSKTSDIIDAVQTEIIYGNYLDAFEVFAEKSEDILNPTISWIYLPLCLLIGFVIAFIIMKIIASANKSVRSQVNATEYVRAGSLNIVNGSEIYLYSHTNVTPKASSNNNSSSRTSGGGRATRSGKF